MSEQMIYIQSYTSAKLGQSTKLLMPIQIVGA